MTERAIELDLPDGARLRVPEGSTAFDAAREIGAGLARVAVAGELDGKSIDLRAPLPHGGRFRVVTTREPEGGDVIRHSAEHVMADAVKRLWPETQIDVGRTDHGEKFQYDFDIPVRISPEDFERIEAEMARIIKSDVPFSRETVSREEARRLFESAGEHLKVSRLDDIPEGEPITLFRHGDFVDLCRGPHLQSTKQIGAFKLTEVAGSYWRGDAKNKMLQRVYGVAFASSKELRQYADRLEQARKRDHRRLGAELDLFQFHEWSPGSPFYLPKGLRLYNALVDYIRGMYRKYGYDEVMCPQIFDVEAFKLSGHYDNYYEDMFWTRTSVEESDTDTGAAENIGLKPMNCPGHCLLFRSRKRSYRELPMRLAEFSRLHRNERSGTLHGLARVRSFAQDDAHVFCEPEQLESEFDRLLGMAAEVFRDLGMKDVEVFVGTRPEQFIGEAADWDEGERILTEAAERAGFPCSIAAGDGAFYGPKIDFYFRDALARSWQLSTTQLDMAMPGRFGLRYVGRDGQEHQPAMIHRAILGSLERFIAVYLEHTAGDLPLWLAPVQAIVLPVKETHEGYAREVFDALDAAGIRCELDGRNETLGYRVRGAETRKLPYAVIIGDREMTDGTVTVRRRHVKAQETLPVAEFRSNLEEEIKTRGIS